METQLETQRNQTLNELKEGREVSSWYVIKKYGVTRLAKYINDFRREGLIIVLETERLRIGQDGG
jgi:hypothetical protein